MATALAKAHIEAQRRLRELARLGVGSAWADLGSWDEKDVRRFLAEVGPLMLAAQRESVAQTDAYLAEALRRKPLGLDSALLVGAGVRSGASPDEVYRRPFVTLWAALGDGRDFEQALAAAQARAELTAETDVQLSMRASLVAAGEQDKLILGYQRVPDGNACKFCRLVSGQRYHKADLMPIHPHCGCGVGVITGAERPDFSGRYDKDQVAVREHGELGPVLGDPQHNFETL